jgi:hypothetical protein
LLRSSLFWSPSLKKEKAIYAEQGKLELAKILVGAGADLNAENDRDIVNAFPG